MAGKIILAQLASAPAAPSASYSQFYSLTTNKGYIMHPDGIARLLVAEDGNGDASITRDLTVTRNLIVSGTGPHAIGVAVDANRQVLIGGSFTGYTGLRVVSTISPPAGTSGDGFSIAPTFNKAGSGTHADFSSVVIDPPTINAGAATLTNSSALKITDAPSVGTNRRALWVAAGLAEFGAGVTLTNGQLYATNNSTTPVVGNTTSSGLYGYFRLDRSGAVKGYVGLDASDSVSLIDASAVAQLKITSGGITIPAYLGIGGNAAGTYSINAAHTGTSTTRVANSIFRGNVGTSNADVNLQLSDGVSHTYYFGGYNGTAYVTTDNNGGVKIAAGATAWSADSDERLKDDLADITDAATKLLTVRAVTGVYKSDPKRRHPFFLAQDILRVQPEAVDRVTTHKGAVTVDGVKYDYDFISRASNADSDEGVLELRYTEVMPLMAAATNEHTRQLAGHNSRLSRIEQHLGLN